MYTCTHYVCMYLCIYVFMYVCMYVSMCQPFGLESRIRKLYVPYTVFPHIRPAGIIFLQGLQLRVLLERGY